MATKGPQYKSIQVDEFLGLNTLDDPKSLNPSYSPYMVNMDITSTGVVQSRFGYERWASYDGEGGIDGLLSYYRVYNDNSAYDQSQDPNGAYVNTYTTPTSIIENATNRLFFTPTKPDVISIGIFVVAKGTGNWTVRLHDASNAILGELTIVNAALVNGQFNYFQMNYKYTSGTLHFHVISTVNDGTLKANVVNDLATASYRETYSTIGDYFLSFYGGKAYYSTNASPTPVEIGAYDTVANPAEGQVRGVVHKNVAVFNDGKPGHLGKYWDAFTLSNLNSGTIYPAIFAKFNSRLFTSGSLNPSNVNFSDSGTIDTNLTTNFEAISLGDGTSVTSIVDAIDKCHVLKENSIEALNYGYDSNYNITTIKQTPIISSQGGNFAPGSLAVVYNYMYFLSKLGFQNYGNLEQGVLANLPLPLSLIIDNTVAQINFAVKNVINGVFFQQRYLCAAPLGASTVANTIFVYSETVKRRYGVDNWVLYQGIPVSQFALFRDENLRDQLYFASSVEPVIYKFNTSFSDNGFGYDRLWRSKTFQFGERTRYSYVDIEGSKPIGAKMYVDIVTDGIEYNGIEITDANFVTQTTGGGYVGDNYIGDSYVGNGYYGADQVPMYKFRVRVQFPETVNEGYATYFQIRNNANNEGWKMTRFKLIYELLPESPTYAYTNTQ